MRRTTNADRRASSSDRLYRGLCFVAWALGVGFVISTRPPWREVQRGLDDLLHLSSPLSAFPRLWLIGFCLGPPLIGLAWKVTGQTRAKPVEILALFASPMLAAITFSGDTIAAFEDMFLLTPGRTTSIVLALHHVVGIYVTALIPSLLLAHPKEERGLASLFVLQSLALGGYALLPGLIWGQSRQTPHERDIVTRLFSSAWTALAMLGWIALGAFLHIVSSEGGGHGPSHGELWQSSLAYRVGLVDCALLLLGFATALRRDLALRGIPPRAALVWPVTLVPILGPLLYLAYRPKLPCGSRVSGDSPAGSHRR